MSQGNAEDIGENRDFYSEYAARGFAVFAYDYRGYGGSEGKPSESGVYSDLQGALRYVRSRGYSSDSIFLIGQSLGTGGADLAAIGLH